MPHIGEAIEYSLKVPTPLLMSWVTVLVLFVLSWLAVRRLRESPGRLQGAFETAFQFIFDLVDSSIGPEGKSYYPLFLGIVVGAVASGAVGRAATRVNAGTFRDVYVDSWLSPFAIAVGLLALALFAFLAAVYLTVAAGTDDLREDFRRSALRAQAAVSVTAFGTLGVAHIAAPEVRETLTRSGWALPLQGGAAFAALMAIGALLRRRWKLARFAAAAQVSVILWGWVVSQYPLLVPPSLSIRDAAAPPVTLRLLAAVLASGAVILVPSLAYLFRTFARSSPADAVSPGEDGD